jgi:molybdenum cofactor guanylyltransferase
MLDHVLAAVDVPDIAISANGDPARFARFGLPVLPDGAFGDHGPLAGVLAGMTWAAALGAEALLTVPGDTPFLPPGLVASLDPAPACATSCGQQHHLVALWRTQDRDLLQTFLLTASGSFSVSRFAREIGVRTVDFPRTDPRWFVNVNTPDDLLRLDNLADWG